MRIVAGTLRGRRLEAPRGVVTRPTSDRVREALFSRLESLGARGLRGGSVLDAYAGTGALGLEALSRGAGHATFVESDPGAHAAIVGNVSSLGVDPASSVLRGDIARLASQGRLPGAPFALLFLDPPYRINKSEVRGVIDSLVLGGAVTPDLLVVWEHATGEAPEWPTGFESLGSRRYGSTTIEIASRRGEQAG